MSLADILFVMKYVNLCVYSGRISRLQMACNAWVKLVTDTPEPGAISVNLCLGSC
jgi:hypothetical protein